jgi:hypothetical protein
MNKNLRGLIRQMSNMTAARVPSTVYALVRVIEVSENNNHDPDHPARWFVA